MIKATFDAPTLADAVQKAARVAPTKGAAYDKASGVLIDLQPAAGVAVLRSTNLDLTYEHELRISDAKGSSVKWRIPSVILSGLLSNLPLSSGSVVTFYDKGDGAIRVVSGATTAKIQVIVSDDYPNLPEVDRTKVSEAQDLSSKVSQVSWACAKDGSILSGVHIDGKHLIACDRNAAALVPCTVPIGAHGITVPLYLLTPILRSATDVKVGVEDHNLLIALDSESHATARILEGEYPNVLALRRTNFTGFATINRISFVEVVNRLMVIARSERLPVMTIEFHTGLMKEAVLDLNVEDTGRIQERFDISGEYEDDFKIAFTPTYLVNAVDNASGDSVKLEFGHKDNPANGPLSSVRISDDKGYEAIVMPRKV